MTSYLRRREFITVLGGITMAWPPPARAQRAERMQRVGILTSFSASDPEAPIRVAAFLQKLQELGWTDRRNIQIAELNARNASDAVIRWKKYRGIYADMTGEQSSAPRSHIIEQLKASL